MKQPSIRKATATDLPAIEALLLSSDLPTAGVKESLSGFLVAESDKQIVGVIGLERCGGYGLLRSTAVAPDWRGKQVARRLVEQIIARAEAQGIQSLYLLTTTAERYFPSFGFTVTTRDSVPEPIRATGEFREACPASATVMRLPLSA
jgi:amino-acid N-acetyltransferase